MLPEIACSDVEQLRRLMLGTLPEPQAASLEEHLTWCARCGDVVDTLTAVDALVETMRAQAALPPQTEGEQIQRLIDALTTLWPAGTALSGAPGAPLEVCSVLAPPQQPGELGRLGPYRVLGVLGAGGMGVVFHGEDTVLYRPAALKTLRPEAAAVPALRQRFLREMRAAAALSHDHIVPVYHVGEEAGVPFLAMPLLQGETLEERLQREGKLPLAEVLRIGREIAAGLAAAHERGLVHRDIKPANIWLEAGVGSAGGRARILDFGLARDAADAAPLTRSGAIAGTPGYLAPEQARAEPVDGRADLFSLGCVLYRMATGQSPFRTEHLLAYLRSQELDEPRPPRELEPSLPPALDGLIRRLLAKDPAGRPTSATAVAEALRAIEQGDVTDREGPAPASARGPLRYLPLILIAALGVGGTAFLGQQLIILPQDRPGRTPPMPPPPQPEPLASPLASPLATPLDRLRRADIPAAERLPGQPDELVAVFGTHAWRSWLGGRGFEDPWSTTVNLLFAPDGKQVIALDRYGAFSLYPGYRDPNGDTVRTWDAATGQELHRFTLRDAGRMWLLPEIRAVGLFVGDAAAWTLKLWDIDTGKEKLSLLKDQLPPASFAASPDGKLILGGQGTRLRLWDAATGKEQPSLPAPAPPAPPARLGEVGAAAFSPDSKLLALLYGEVGGGPRPRRSATLKVYDMTTRTEVGGAHVEGILFHSRPVFTPDSKAILVGRMENGKVDDTLSVRLWDVAQQRWGALNVPGGAFALSPDGKHVAVGARKRASGDTLAPGGVYAIATGARITGFDGPPITHALTFSPDGKRVAGVNETGPILVYNAADGKRLTPHSDPFTFLAVSGDGTLMAVPEPRYEWEEYRSGPTLLRLVNTVTGEVRCPIPRVPETQGFRSAAFSTDSKVLAVVNAGFLQRYDTASGERMPALGQTRDRSTVAFSASGKWLVCRVAGAPGQQLKVWDAATWQVKGAIPAPFLDGNVQCVPAVSPDGCRVAAPSGRAGQIALKIFDLATGKELFSGTSGQRGGPYALSPDWRRAAYDGKLFDTTTGKEFAVLKGVGPKAMRLTDLLFMPDGKSLFGSCDDGRLIRWSAADGSVLKAWQLGGYIQRLALTTDGRHLFVSNQNGTVYVLRLAPPARAG